MLIGLKDYDVIFVNLAKFFKDQVKLKITKTETDVLAIQLSLKKATKLTFLTKSLKKIILFFALFLNNLKTLKFYITKSFQQI